MLRYWGQQTSSSLLSAFRPGFCFLSQSILLNISECPEKEKKKKQQCKLNKMKTVWIYMSSAFWLTEATTLPQNGKIILQLRIIFLFFPVSSLEMNMKNMDLNHISARGYLLFLLIIQTLEEKKKSQTNIFLNYFWHFPWLCSSFSPFLWSLKHNLSVQG